MKKMYILLIGFGVLTFFLIVVVFVAMTKYAKIGRLVVTSPDFKNNEFLDSRFSCDGLDLIPTIKVDDIPLNTKSLFIIIDDPDAPKDTWVHFVAWNIKTNGKTSLTLFDDNTDNIIGFIRGKNSFDTLKWGGPCPPKGHGIHRYFFKIYAVNKEKIDLKEGADKEKLLDEMQGFNLSYGEIIGKYKRD